MQLNTPVRVPALELIDVLIELVMIQYEMIGYEGETLGSITLLLAYATKLLLYHCRVVTGALGFLVGRREGFERTEEN